MPQEPPDTPDINRKLFFITLGLVLLYAVFILPLLHGQHRYPIAYSRFKQFLAQGEVKEVELRGHHLEGTLTATAPIGPNNTTASLFTTAVPELGDPSLLPALEAHGVTVRVVDSEDASWQRLLLFLLPWLVLFSFFWGLLRSSRRLGGGINGPGELQRFLTRRTQKAEVPAVTFKDVAGQANAKTEVWELVDFLSDSARYRALGAEVPRGVLLMGPPGTGKTLLARALAGEAGVPFYPISGSEFIELFVGVGAARVRNLFETAKKNAPGIIFIDELDSVGRTRGTGLGGGHDEREQTLNQLLAEMDGFSGHEAVLVVAATNRPDVLDPALLRPGRFDRHVTLDLPDRSERVEVLKVHSRSMPLAADVDLDQLAAVTPGFSGADLKNLVNEAAMSAARHRLTTVSAVNFEEARDKLLLGTVRSMAIAPEEHHRLAVHEAGHALVAFFHPHTDPLLKVTIIPRGRALGTTQQLPEKERHTLPEEYLRARLALTLGGRTAELEVLASASSGADDDIRQATALARAMVSRWGMSADIGPVDLRESEEHPFLGREIAQPRRFSENSAQAVDQAVRKLLLAAEEEARSVIRERRSALERLIAALENRETLSRTEIEACLTHAS